MIERQRPPNVKEIQAFEARLARLKGRFAEDVNRASQAAERFSRQSSLDTHGFRVRHSFSYLSRGSSGEYSDRRVMPRELRPPATRILSSKGATLRLYLMALAVAQMAGSAGSRLPVLPVIGRHDSLGWTHLVATGADNAGDGSNFITALDKRGRSIKTSLDTLAKAGLVELRPSGNRPRAFEKFVLLHESGKGGGGDSVEYKVPKLKESVISVPAGFVRSSWIHVLEDTELSVLLMIACGKGSLREEDGVIAIPSETRLTRYGVARDPYSRARKTLELFGLVSVSEIGRHEDGKAEDGDTKLHRFKILPEGFDNPALETVRSALEQSLG